MRQAKKHIHNAQLYTLYNKGVNSVASICGLQKHEEKNEKKIAKYLVVPNICILSLSLSLSLSL
ncbi:MAG: hypothetical protein D8B57_10700 [Prevotella sp.]|nr:MAG: hypothetical protein D8B57_10700 [Prevotella sp.]